VFVQLEGGGSRPELRMSDPRRASVCVCHLRRRLLCSIALQWTVRPLRGCLLGDR